MPTEPIHDLALVLADEAEAFASGIGAWGTTASLLRQAASSLRWQVNWERKHPSDAAYSVASMAARSNAIGPEEDGS